jgi:hypothetical protein
MPVDEESRNCSRVRCRARLHLCECRPVLAVVVVDSHPVPVVDNPVVHPAVDTLVAAVGNRLAEDSLVVREEDNSVDKPVQEVEDNLAADFVDNLVAEVAVLPVVHPAAKWVECCSWVRHNLHKIYSLQGLPHCIWDNSYLFSF